MFESSIALRSCNQIHLVLKEQLVWVSFLDLKEHRDLSTCEISETRLAIAIFDRLSLICSHTEFAVVPKHNFELRAPIQAHNKWFIREKSTSSPRKMCPLTFGKITSSHIFPSRICPVHTSIPHKNTPKPMDQSIQRIESLRWALALSSSPQPLIFLFQKSAPPPHITCRHRHFYYY